MKLVDFNSLKILFKRFIPSSSSETNKLVNASQLQEALTNVEYTTSKDSTIDPQTESTTNYPTTKAVVTYVSGVSNDKLDKSGGTMTGSLTLNADPTTDLHAATKKYVDTSISNLPSPMVFKGSLGEGGTIQSLPEASSDNSGNVYKVITEGTYSEQEAKIGDLFISDGSSWIYIPSADEPNGTVTSVGITLPVGLHLKDSSVITTSGTFEVEFDECFGLFTDIDEENLDTAYTHSQSTHAPTTSKDASPSGTDLSLVTTGEKSTWNNKQDGLTITQLSSVNSGITSDNVDYITKIAEVLDITEEEANTIVELASVIKIETSSASKSVKIGNDTSYISYSWNPGGSGVSMHSNSSDVTFGPGYVSIKSSDGELKIERNNSKDYETLKLGNTTIYKIAEDSSENEFNNDFAKSLVGSVIFKGTQAEWDAVTDKNKYIMWIEIE